LPDDVRSPVDSELSGFNLHSGGFSVLGRSGEIMIRRLVA